jgi:hypothetical protein
LITANIFFNKIGNWEAFRKQVLIQELGSKLIAEQGYDKESPPLEAYVNHGRWVVKCECEGCELAWEEGWFMCRSCFNAKHKHKYRRVIFPGNRRQIEGLLLLRPLLNRNWRSNETLAFLRAENKEHKEELLNGME